MRRSGWFRIAANAFVIAVAFAIQGCATPAGQSEAKATTAGTTRSPAASAEASAASAQPRSSAEAPSSGAAPSAIPSSATESVAAEYLRWAGDSNDAMDDLWARYPNDFASLGEAALYYREYAEITRRFADHVLTMEFPAGIADDARQLVRRLNEEVNAAMRASQASSWDELWLAEEDLDRVSGFSTDAANRVRAGLGLPSAPPIGVDEEP